jgi:membrane-bound serine protease (ClpP class)
MRIRFVLWILLVELLAAGLGTFLPLKTAAAAPTASSIDSTSPVVMLRFEGALHPVMLEHLKRAQQIAQRDQAQAIILELDTPGGEITLMNYIVEQIRASQIPVIVYISPRGAMAGSAGTMITLAGHLSAMAPETAIGAASPVGPNGEDIGQTLQSKYKEMLKATVRTLAADRPPEAVKLAQDMIDSARAVSTDEAVKVGLVDFKANDLQDLLKQIDGRQVKMGGQTHILHTASAPVNEVKMSFMEEALTVLANPNIAFLLLAVGVQAILIEISSPGGWVAGFIGAICLLLATYGMGLLPVNWFGLLFLALAFALFILDIKAPTHGALTAAGVASFIVGALVLFNSPNVPSFQRVSVPLVVATGLALGVFFFIIVGFALRAQKTPLKMGTLSLLGQVGVVNTPLNPTGTVQLGSELWTAIVEDGGQLVPKGAHVEVIALDRLQIRVRKVDEQK